MLDLSNVSAPSLAEALFARNSEPSGDLPSLAEFLGKQPKSPSARLQAGRAGDESTQAPAPAHPRPRANPIQLRLPGFDLLSVRPEKRPWPVTIAPAKRPRKKGPYLHAKKSGEYAAMSYSQISRALGVSVERIRQLEANALRKCRVACEKLGLGPDVLLDVIRGAR